MVLTVAARSTAIQAANTPSSTQPSPRGTRAMTHWMVGCRMSTTNRQARPQAMENFRQM